ncbi:hypothetical protein HK405_014447 [Cladochytrium tenue]|nr:hypothetical protein HK405_014447 [Cladochytrium tenue]
MGASDNFIKTVLILFTGLWIDRIGGVLCGFGFASTLGMELGLGKIGSFIGQSTANIIATRTGNFAWVY